MTEEARHAPRNAAVSPGASDPGRRPGRILVTLGGLLLANGCGVQQRGCDGQACPPGTEVRVPVPMGHGLSTSNEKVRIDLYHYPNAGGGLNPYVVSGRPLSLLVPKSALASNENMVGGAQREILFRIDSMTYPTGALICRMRVVSHPGA